MNENLNNRLNELIDEVCDFFTSDRLLQPMATEAPVSFPCFRKPIGMRVTSLKEFVADIDARNPKSACQELDEEILGGTLETMWFDLKGFQIYGEFGVAREIIDRLYEDMRSNTRLVELTRRIAEEAFPYCSDTIDFDDLYGVVFGRPGVHADRIITARTIMMGRRYGITEALFEAYKNGLMPYGWDIHSYSLVCISPQVE